MKDSCGWHDSAPSFQAIIEAKDWEFIGEDTHYLTHNLHRYSGKFIPNLARQAIQLLSKAGDLILDPYVGSGTTLLEATATGRESIGVDMNPLAVLIASVKVRPIADSALTALVRHFQLLVAEIENASRPSLLVPDSETQSLLQSAREDPRFTDPWYAKWFQPHVLNDLVVLHRAIESLGDPSCKNLALVAFSDILRRSSNAHSGYPNVMFDKNMRRKSPPARIFLRSLQESVDMVRRLDSQVFEKISPTIVMGDAAHLPLDSSSVDAVVSHPPYVGSIPYAEYCALSLHWLGSDAKELDARLTGGKRQSKNVLERFRSGYAGMLSESYRVLRPGKKMFLMVGNPVVRGEVIDLADMTRTLAAQAGFDLIAETYREGTNRRANKMGREILLFFEKSAHSA